jgi:hypothetical protein
VHREEKKITVESEGKALLVVIASYFPPDPLARLVGQIGSLSNRWKAEVDGVSVRTYAAFHYFVAVPVPEGKHEVKVWFEGG